MNIKKMVIPTLGLMMVAAHSLLADTVSVGAAAGASVSVGLDTSFLTGLLQSVLGIVGIL